MNRFLFTLALVSTVDSISYMIVTPSLVFYVLECGGTQEQYGLILSIFSFASFCGKPILGYWVDAAGNKYRAPYMTSISLAAFGAFLYFVASAFRSPFIAVGLIFCGRFFGGFGAANQALGFAYLASAVPPEKQTVTSSLLSSVRIIGMAAGPGFNVLLARVNRTFSIANYTFHLTRLNSVGLFLMAGNLLTLLLVYVLLEEPPEREKRHKPVPTSHRREDKLKHLKAFCCIEILLPVYTLFATNTSFQL